MTKITFDELELRLLVAQANGWLLQKVPKGERLKTEVRNLLEHLGNW